METFDVPLLVDVVFQFLQERFPASQRNVSMAAEQSVRVSLQASYYSFVIVNDGVNSTLQY